MLTTNLPIFTLEGPPFAGKTTLLHYLEENYSDQIKVIPESGEYVGGDGNFPRIPFSDFEAAKMSTHFFLCLEEKRCKDALRLFQKYKVPVVMDRINSISTPIFYKLLGKNHASMHKFEENFFLHSLRIFQEALRQANIFMPNKIIYLTLSNKKLFEGRIHRGASTCIFQKWSTFSFLDGEYHSILEKFDNSLVLQSTNSRYNKKTLAKQFVMSLNTEKSFEINLFDIFRQKKSPKSVNLKKERDKYKLIYEKCTNLMELANLHLD